MDEVTEDTNLGELIDEHPEVARVLRNHGLGCVGCAIAGRETVKQAAMSHGIDLKPLLERLNEKIEES